jgi:hypothetical protein
MRKFENRVQSWKFGPKRRNEVTGGWRKLHNEELHNLYSSPSIIRMIKSRKMRWTGHVENTVRRGIHTRFWWESQKERDPLGKPRCTRKDNINTNLKDTGWGGMDCIRLAQEHALVNMLMNLRVPWNGGKFLSSWATGGLSKTSQPHEVSFQLWTLGPVSCYNS